MGQARPHLDAACRARVGRGQRCRGGGAAPPRIEANPREKISVYIQKEVLKRCLGEVVAFKLFGEEFQTEHTPDLVGE